MRAAALAAFALLMATAWLPALAQWQGPGASTLTVSGNVERELALSIDELKQLPTQRIEDARVVREQGYDGGTGSRLGATPVCLLRDVLDRAKLTEKIASTCAACGHRDGHRRLCAVFSWAELSISRHRRRCADRVRARRRGALGR